MINAPLFSPDGRSILFSAGVPEEATKPSWEEKLFGIQVAKADTLPSDWCSVSMFGGRVSRLTHLQAHGLFGSVSPDRRFIASYSAGGLFVMNPDGNGVTMLVPDTGGILGTVSWLP